MKASIDYLDGQGYKEFMNVVDSGAPDYFFNKSMFKALSWFWVRLNNADFRNELREVARLKGINIKTLSKRSQSKIHKLLR